MTTTRSATSTAIAVAGPVFTNPEQLALAGFLAGYAGLTRQAYALDLRQYASWCQQRHLRLFEARRADIECFARDLEARGRARATITRRVCTIAGFYRYAVEEELLDHSPAVHVRRPRLDYESHATGLDRKRARRDAGRCRARDGSRTRADLPARFERPAGVRGHRCGHSGSRRGTRAPDADHHPQGRRGRHYPAGAAHRPGHRPGHRRTARRTDLPRPRAGGGWIGTAPRGSARRSSSGPSTGPRRPASGPAVTARPTPCSPSSNSSADRPRIMPRFSPGHHRHPG